MTDKDQTVIFSLNGNDGLPERLKAFDDFNPTEERPATLANGLVSLAFIRGALRRTVAFWCAMAIVGLVIGVGINLKFPPAYKASTSVLITYAPGENPSGAVLDNQAIAQSRSVAQAAMAKLGIHETVGSFAAATTVTVVTERVLGITVSAPTSDAAVSRASAVANSFLQIRARQIETGQKLLLTTLQNVVNRDEQTVTSISAHIGRVSAEPVTTAQQGKLRTLHAQLSQAQTQVGVDQQTLEDTKASTATMSAITGSVILDPAQPLAHSHLKYLVIYAFTGMVLGLFTGIGLVVVRAILSNRLRRRDDVTSALGTPVRLSVRPLGLSRWRPGRHGLGATDNAGIRRIAAHLRAAVPHTVRGADGLAVIAVDDPGAAALSVVSLAMSRAREGRTVVVADLASGAPVAALLGSKGPGVRSLSVRDTQLTLAVPDRDDLSPFGPSGPAPADEPRSEFTAAVSEACASADLLLTLVTLDPSIGADHVASWASRAVAVITVGRSSWAKIHGVGEMVRLAGVSLVSAVLVGVDKNDESLGVTEQSGTLATPAELGLGT
jgi:capsular polysaccharide biosynthesis protein